MQRPPEPFRYSPIVDRPRLVWPGGARVALWIAPNVEYYEFDPPRNPYRTAWPRVPQPDVMSYAWRDYGNRVGFWRLLEVFDEFRIRATVSLNTAVLGAFPEVRDAMVERDWAFMAHGTHNTRFLFGLDVEEERALIAEMAATVERETGKRLKGMFGPHASITPNTMALMAEADLTYSADWYADDQPFPLDVPQGRLVCVPYSWELNDGLLLSPGIGRYDADYFLQICKDQFDVLYEEGAESGRVMCIVVHTSTFGQPHRIAYLREALDYILSHDAVWVTTADDIADHYLENVYDAAVAHGM